MNITRARSIAAAGIAIAAVLTFADTANASASTIPASAQSCTSGQAKLDYSYFNGAAGPTWSNVCGETYWNVNTDDGSITFFEVRMPTSPTYRIWFHSEANNDGNAYCMYSQNTDIDIDVLVAEDGAPEWLYDPGSIQVSANTSPC